MVFAASYLAVHLLAAPVAVPPGVPAPEKVSNDWAAAPPLGRKDIHNTVRDILAEEHAELAQVPRRHEADTLRGDKYDSFAADFEEAAVPGCLRPDALKRQPPRIGMLGLGGLLGLPFVLLAKIRGKCN
ncbi:MAG: hypothetical protein V4484_07815 [Pseudomonadota bacterium]